MKTEIAAVRRVTWLQVLSKDNIFTVLIIYKLNKLLEGSL